MKMFINKPLRGSKKSYDTYRTLIGHHGHVSKGQVTLDLRRPLPTKVAFLSLRVNGKSRASEAALSTVLRTTTLSYGNMRFSGNCPAETPQLIKMKFARLIMSTSLRDVPKMVGIGWLEAAPEIGEI
jgi:hypothetical protein